MLIVESDQKQAMLKLRWHLNENVLIVKSNNKKQFYLPTALIAASLKVGGWGLRGIAPNSCCSCCAQV